MKNKSSIFLLSTFLLNTATVIAQPAKVIPPKNETSSTEETQSDKFDEELDEFMDEISSMLGLPFDSASTYSSSSAGDVNTSSSSLFGNYNFDWSASSKSGIKKLNTVNIGSQTWTAENLDKSAFLNGDEIPEIKSDADWEKAYDDKKPAWCYYKNDPANAELYGKLYNWWAVIDTRGLAPVGYHIPSKSEWDKLTAYLGTGAGKKMKAKTGWKQDGNGTSENSFDAMPGGFRETAPSSFGSMGEFAYFWSSTTGVFFGFELGGGIYVNYDSSEATFDSYAAEGLSVRCIKD